MRYRNRQINPSPRFRDPRDLPVADVPFAYGAGHHRTTTVAEEVQWYPSGQLQSVRRVRQTRVEYDPSLAAQYVAGDGGPGIWARWHDRIATAFAVAPVLGFLGLGVWAGITLWGLAGLCIAVGILTIVVVGATYK